MASKTNYVGDTGVFDDGINNTPIGESVSKTGKFTDIDITGKLQGNIENDLNSIKLSGDVLGIMTDPKLFNALCETPLEDFTAYLDISGNNHGGTYTGDWGYLDRIKQGKSWVLDPNGIDAYIDFGYHDDFSFAGDSPFTVGMVIQQDATASIRTLISKWNETTNTEDREWKATLTADHKAKLELFDESEAANQNPSVTSSALSTGFHFIVFTYNGVGGTDADDGLNCYVDGVLNSTTRSGNQASYTTMEAGVTPLLIGAFESTAGVMSAFGTGDFGSVMLDAVEMSATDVWRMYQYMLAAYSENGITL